MSLVMKSISIEKIVTNNNRVRKEMENDRVKIEVLALHIAENGLLQPIIVKELENGNYLIVKGERRYQACIFNGAEKVECIVTDSSEPDIIGLSVTLTRKDLKETEKAEALYKIRTQYELSNVALARKLGITEGYIRKLIKIHDLPDDVKQDINDGKTTAHEAVNGHKRSTQDQSKSKNKESSNTQETLQQLKKEKEMLVNALRRLNLTESQQHVLFQNISEQYLREELKQAMGQ